MYSRILLRISFPIIAAFIAPLFLLAISQNNNALAEERIKGPTYDTQGLLLRADGWRKWVFIGAPLTPNSLNDGAAPFPEFHNVYMEPKAFEHLENTGKFANGTMIAKELVSIGETEAVSGSGYFQGDFQGLEFAVKDTERFPNEPGGWVYFTFGHELPYQNKAKALPTEDCAACHEAAADFDMVFTQYYPILEDARKR